MIMALVYSAILPFKNSIPNWKFTVSFPLISSWSLYTLWIFCGFWPQGWRAVKPSWSSRWQLSWSCLRRPCWPRARWVDGRPCHFDDFVSKRWTNMMFKTGWVITWLPGTSIYIVRSFWDGLYKMVQSGWNLRETQRLFFLWIGCS